jgi:hypothetical protein
MEYMTPRLRANILKATSSCHSERSEESRIKFAPILPTEIGQTCFAKPVLSEVEGLNITALRIEKNSTV